MNASSTHIAYSSRACRWTVAPAAPASSLLLHPPQPPNTATAAVPLKAAANAATYKPPQQETQRLKLTVAYDGSGFAGFQWQAGKVRTVQSELERAAARVLMLGSRCVGASRTDGGAHALGQVCHLDAVGSRESFQLETLQLYLNGALAPDVKVQRVELAPEGE